MTGIGEVAAGISTRRPVDVAPPGESTAVRMFRKALAKEKALNAKLKAEEERVAPRVNALGERIERIRRRALTLECKVRDAKTQRLIRWQKLNGGEQGHLNLAKVERERRAILDAIRKVQS
jgi:hypothetical protein